MSAYEQKMLELQKLQSQVSNISEMVNSKERAVNDKLSRMRQGQVPVENARDLEYQMNKNLGPMLAPSNLGDINKIIWPYFFSTEVPNSPIGPNETFQSGFSITQEAAFIMMSFTKSVYEVDTNTSQWTYLDPNADDYNSRAPNLTFSLRDGSSSRQFFNRPIELAHYGNPRFPTKFPRPIMLLPNQVMEVSFVNSHPTKTYVPFITAFGYRMRIEDAQKFLSLVYA